MRLGFSLPNNQGVRHVEELAELAVAAESLGYSSVWVSEHLFHTSYVAARLGDAPYHEPLTTLTAVAARTTSVRLGTSVLVLPWHHPVRLAKAIASLDDLSKGRAVLGIGVANAEDEYANLGISFKQRGAIANEILEAMTILWRDDVPRFEGRYFQFDGLRFEPKPVQTPHPPIFVGGNSEPAYRRVVRFGDGWHPLSLSAGDVMAGRERIHRLCEEAGRDPPSIAITPRLMAAVVDEPWDRPVEARRTLRGTIPELRAMIRAYERAGVAELVIDANSRDLDATRTLMERIANELMV